ncbi:MAG: acyltransferase family protein [Verrucomicrobiota bacterium]
MNKETRLDSLTSVRFVAALLVYLYHAEAHFRLGEAPAFQGLPATLTHLGFLGVPFFFQLSGFILTVVYASRLGPGAEPGWRAGLRPYLVARLARVYPLYLAGLVLSLPLVAFDARATAATGLEVWLSLALSPLLLQAWFPSVCLLWNAPGWSLSVEAAFYLAFPFLLRFFLRVRRSHLPGCYGLAILVAALASGWITVWSPALGAPGPFAVPAPPLHHLSRYFPLLHLPAFLAGIIAGRWYLERPAPMTPRGRAATLAVLLGVPAGLLLGADLVPHLHWHNWLMIPFFSLVILFLARQDPRIGWLRTRIPVLLGEASYAFYLLHIVVIRFYLKGLELVDGTRPSGLLHATICLFLGLGLSVLALVRVERPARQWMVRVLR